MEVITITIIITINDYFERSKALLGSWDKNVILNKIVKTLDTWHSPVKMYALLHSVYLNRERAKHMLNSHIDEWDFNAFSSIP